MKDNERGCTQAWLKARIHYDEDTGVFTRLGVQGRLNKEAALTPTSNGYFTVCVEGSNFKAHRLAFLYVTGMWPVEGVDHKNGDKRDTRFSNLRLATSSENNHNRSINTNSKTGVKGVHFSNRRGKFVAQVRKKGSKGFNKEFDTLEEAREAIKIERERLHGLFAKHQ